MKWTALGSALLLFEAALGQLVAQRPNCFDYTATLFDTDIYNDLGFTTGMTLKPLRTCEVDINTGIARFVYESGMAVQMFVYNSLGQPIRLGGVSNGQIVYWYGFDGKAASRKFVFTNPTRFPLSMRITIQTLKGMLKKSALCLQAGALLLLGLGLLAL